MLGAAMMVLVQLLRVVTFLLGIVQLVWIARYVYEDFGGIIGVIVAWVVFPLTLIVSPILWRTRARRLARRASLRDRPGHLPPARPARRYPDRRPLG